MSILRPSSTSSPPSRPATRIRTGGVRPTTSASESSRYDATIHLKTLDASWGRIAELTSTPDLQEQFYCRNSTGAGSKVSDYYTPELLGRVVETYRRDYETLDYPLPI